MYDVNCIHDTIKKKRVRADERTYVHHNNILPHGDKQLASILYKCTFWTIRV